MSRELEVWADWRELAATMRMGHLRSTPSRGKEVFSFSYDQAWLDAGHSRQLDPDLRFFSGPQYLNATDRPNFGIFLDSSPDRWGRLLMQRREAAQAREEGRSAHRLQETDYLLGVHDEQRTGALRFKEPISGFFVTPSRMMAELRRTGSAEIPELAEKRAFPIVECFNQFGNDRIEARISLAMGVSDEVHRLTVHGDIEIGTVVKIEATDEVLVRLAVAGVLRDDHARHDFE